MANLNVLKRSPVSLAQHYWHYLRQQPLPQPEESIALRVLVQLLVAVGIVSIDIAAVDLADSMWISVWAVPASALGATWSWFRRRRRNVFVKFCIALGMLLSLAVFFVRLVNSTNDTRLALAELLIQLQVFHSFDLPRRKDLGYSTVIGLILLGVSATLSQTLGFGLIVVLFLAIAIPILVLDYRSQLGLPSLKITGLKTDLSLRRLSLVFLIVLGLGLGIFAFLPRFPGYQLRSFPVSSPIDFQGQFDSENIINPGYVRQGRGGNSITGENAGGDGPGQLDSDFYYGFNSRINQNLRGELQPKVVMRVRSQAPGFWRVMAFDHYTGQGWEVSRNSDDQVEILNRPSWTFRFNVPWSITPNPTKEIIQSYTVVADLPNLIPSLYEPKELYFPTRQIARDPEGALRAPIPLSEGLTYTVVSEVPYRDRTRLGAAPVDYPNRIRDYYLEVPSSIAQRVQQETQRILDGSPKPLTNPYEKSLYLAQYLKQNYTIQPELPFLEESEDLVEAFLFKYNGGYPDHFSTVLTIMLRSIGIPTRLVVGFGSGEFNPFTGFYVVRNSDAFAMTEVYFPKQGWFAFNPIPGREVVFQEVEESQTFSVLRQFWNWIAGWLPSPLTGLINHAVEWVVSAVAWAIATLTYLLSNGWVAVLLLSGGTTVLALLGWLLFSWMRQWRYGRWLSRLPGMEALYQRLLNYLTTRGWPKSASQTPLEYAQQVRSQCPDAEADIVDEICHAYMRWRYGRQDQNLAYLQQRFRLLTQRDQRERSHVWQRRIWG